MKTIVVVDDVRSFEQEFLDLQTDDYAIDYCVDAQSAIALLVGMGLAEIELDELWLDHDLGLAGTTLPIANFLEGLACEGHPFPVHKIFIHTANPAGANRLQSGLRDYNVEVVGDPRFDYRLYDQEWNK